MLAMHLASTRERDKCVVLMLLWGFCIWCSWHVGDLGIKVVNMLGSSCTLWFDAFGWPSFLSQKFEVGDNWRIGLIVSHKRQEKQREREELTNYSVVTVVCVRPIVCCTLKECKQVGVYKGKGRVSASKFGIF